MRQRQCKCCIAQDNGGLTIVKKQKKETLFRESLKIETGSYLVSHTVASAVPSAYKSLTSVFGMGTGVSS